VRRRDQRRAAVFAVYQHDVTGTPVDELLGEDATPWSHSLAEATIEELDSIDGLIDKHASGWDVNRLAPLDKAILRVAVLEITHPSASGYGTPIPPEGAIDEAVQTAKEFCGTDAPGFVNGILAAVLEERRSP
jgi:N utilization substance protein B